MIGYLITHNLIITLVLGGIAWGITSIIIFYTKYSLESKPTDNHIYEGELATVEIPFSKNEIGRISVINSKSGQNGAFPARAIDPNDPPYKKGDKVFIEKLNGIIAVVKKSVKWELKKLKKE